MEDTTAILRIAYISVQTNVKHCLKPHYLNLFQYTTQKTTLLWGNHATFIIKSNIIFRPKIKSCYSEFALFESTLFEDLLQIQKNNSQQQAEKSSWCLCSFACLFSLFSVHARLTQDNGFSFVENSFWLMKENPICQLRYVLEDGERGCKKISNKSSSLINLITKAAAGSESLTL